MAESGAEKGVAGGAEAGPAHAGGHVAGGQQAEAHQRVRSVTATEKAANMGVRNGVEMEDAGSDGQDTEEEHVGGKRQGTPAELDADHSEDNPSQNAKKQAPRRSVGRMSSEITKEELAQCFHMPSELACKRLGIGLTVLKRQCRKYGIKRWPFRKMKSLDRLIENIQSSVAPGEQSRDFVKSVEELRSQRERMEKGLELELDEETKKLQQAYSKANHKMRRQGQRRRPDGTLEDVMEGDSDGEAPHAAATFANWSTLLSSLSLQYSQEASQMLAHFIGQAAAAQAASVDGGASSSQVEQMNNAIAAVLAIEQQQQQQQQQQRQQGLLNANGESSVGRAPQEIQALVSSYNGNACKEVNQIEKATSSEKEELVGTDMEDEGGEEEVVVSEAQTAATNAGACPVEAAESAELEEEEEPISNSEQKRALNASAPKRIKRVASPLSAQKLDAPALEADTKADGEEAATMGPGVRATKRKTIPTAKLAEASIPGKGIHGTTKHKAATVKAADDEQPNGGKAKSGVKRKKGAADRGGKQGTGHGGESLSAADALASLASMADLLEQEDKEELNKTPAPKRGRPRKKPKTVTGDAGEAAEKADNEESVVETETKREREVLSEVDVLARLQIYAQQMGYLLQNTTLLALRSSGKPPGRPPNATKPSRNGRRGRKADAKKP